MSHVFVIKERRTGKIVSVRTLERKALERIEELKGGFARYVIEAHPVEG